MATNVYEGRASASRSYSHPSPKVKPPPKDKPSPKVKPPPLPRKRSTPTDYHHMPLVRELPQKKTSSCHDECTVATLDDAMVSSDKVYRLTDFIEHYSHLLPLRIKVTEGYCGKDEDSVISAGDVYNFHFIKNEKVVSIQDDGGKVFSLPLNSSIQFGVLYDPIGDTKRALGGYLFKTIGDVMKCNVLPRVIRATKICRGYKTDSSVDADEILIITSVHRTATERQKSHIRTFSLSTRKEKMLYEDCKGHFLTNPGSMRLFLSDIVEHLKESLPLEAVLFLDYNTYDDKIAQLESEVITLNQVNVETSIVATSCLNETEDIPDIDDDNTTPVAIPIDLKISLSINGDDFEDEVLYEDTRQLYNNFHLSHVKTMSSSENYMELRESTRSDYDYQALEVIRPSKVFSEVGFAHPPSNDHKYKLQPNSSQLPVKSDLPVSRPTSKGTSFLSSDARSSNSNAYELQQTCIAPPPLPVESNLPKVSKINTSFLSANAESTSCDPYVTLNPDTKRSQLVASSEFEAKDLKQLNAQLKLVLSTLSDLMDKYDSLHQEVMQIKHAVGISREVAGMHSILSRNVTPHILQKNVKELKSLTCHQVQRLLQKMNLSQYVALFSTEGIDGLLLSEFDENILQHELHITSFIHRAKLMKLIKGSESAMDYLKK